MRGREDTYHERLEAAARLLKASGALNRSEPQLRLFEFLLARSLADQVPKEIEIAQEVFGKTSDFDMMQDASVRVYVHRLRRKLDDHNARLPAQAARLEIPLGEYRLALSGGKDPPEEIAAGEAQPLPAADPPSAPRRPASPRRLPAWPPAFWPPAFWVIAVLFLAINAAGWLGYLGARHADPDRALLRGALWRPLFESSLPTYLVAGDYYIFGEMDDGFNVNRLVRDFAVNSHADLDGQIVAHPEEGERYLDLDLHYLPTSIAPALSDLMPVLDALAGGGGRRPLVGTMSGTTPMMLKNANMVYLGFLSGLGLLRDPLFRASGFRIGSNYDELIDKASGRTFTSDWGVVVDGKTPQRDYAYLASLPGPSGNRILVIAGTRDAAVSQAAQIAADPQQWALIADRATGEAFEALFEVRTLGNVNLSSSLVLARPMRADGIWRSDDLARAADRRSEPRAQKAETGRR